MKKIVIDTMGADRGIDVFVKGAILAREAYPNYKVVFVGNKEELEQSISKTNLDEYEIVDAKETFLNTDSPMDLVKGKNETSLVKGLETLKNDDECVAMISAGSTGGFLVGSIFRLGLIEGIKFPALASPMINIHEKWFALLDCGANLDIDAKTLLKFSKMGTALMKSAFGNLENPRVGLLNVGKEETKGNALAKEAYGLLKESNLNFIGNIEGHEIYLDKADVIACDGFVGNVVLKFAEGLAKTILKLIKEAIKDGGIFAKLGALLLMPTLKKLGKRLDVTEYGGAPLLGINGCCIISHGSSDAKSICSAIGVANGYVKSNVLGHICDALAKEEMVARDGGSK